MVMVEDPKRRETFLLKRGAYDAPGERVFAAVPAVSLIWLALQHDAAYGGGLEETYPFVPALHFEAAFRTLAETSSQALATTVDPAPAAQADEQQAPRTASLYPTTDEVRRQVSTVEARRNATSPMGSRDWWYLVAAIAVGVIIAAILL